MKYRKLIVTGCLLAFSMVPVYASASTERTGLAACTDAMVSGIKTRSGVPLEFRMDKRSSGSATRLGARETFHLDVKDPVSSAVLARADCIVNRRGEVIELIKLPLDSANAEVRAFGMN